MCHCSIWCFWYFVFNYVMLNGNRNLYSLYRFNVNKLHMPLTIIINGWNYFQAKVAMISLCPNSCGLTYDLCDSFCFVKVRLLFRTIQASCVDSHVTNVTPKHSLEIVYTMDDSLYITHRNYTTFRSVTIISYHYYIRFNYVFRVYSYL